MAEPREGDRQSYRPHNLSRAALGFTPRRPVAWFSPLQLAGTAVRVLGATLFDAVMDKRELQAALPDTVYDHRADATDASGKAGSADSSGSAGSADGAAEGELWFDYVADVGDGFNATYSMAWLLAQPTLAVPAGDGTEHTLPRGALLIMGGDEVYPTPSRRGYEDRTRGPYRAALPLGQVAGEDTGPRPALYALPGNHDWYDGLTSFLRLFTKGTGFGRWRTRQARSYFAIQLPHRWWLFALDESLTAYLDDPQLRYFRQAAAALRPGDRVIVCLPRPTWVYASRDPDGYDTTDYFLRTIIEPTGATVPLLLAGDLHHYARYQPDPEHPQPDSPPDDNAPADSPPADGPQPGGPPPDRTQADGPQAGSVPAGGTKSDGTESGRTLLTCGGGGAYLYVTHPLPERLTVPPPDTLRRDASPSRPYRLATTFPSGDDSRRLGWAVFRRILTRSPSFAGLLGLLHTLLMYAFITAGHRVLTLPVLLGVAVTMTGTIGFAMSERDLHHRARHWLCGIGHGLGHLALAVLGALVWWQLPLVHLPGPLPVLLSAVLYLPVLGVLAAELTAGYLLLVSRLRVNVNELSVALADVDRKSFLRLHLAADGTLSIYPVGLRTVARHWVATPDNPSTAPWIDPTAALRPHLIEPPLRFPR